MSTVEADPQAVRPYFLPEGIDFNALPIAVQSAFVTIVDPAYQELVIAAPNALERSMGASIVFLLAEEVLNHFEIGRHMDLAQTGCSADRELRDQAWGRHLKLLGAKNAAQNALLRLRKLPPSSQFASSIPPPIA